MRKNTTKLVLCGLTATSSRALQGANLRAAQKSEVAPINLEFERNIESDPLRFTEEEI